MECWDELLEFNIASGPRRSRCFILFGACLPIPVILSVATRTYARQQEARRTHELSDIDGKQTRPRLTSSAAGCSCSRVAAREGRHPLVGTRVKSASQQRDVGAPIPSVRYMASYSLFPFRHPGGPARHRCHLWLGGLACHEHTQPTPLHFKLILCCVCSSYLLPLHA